MKRKTPIFLISLVFVVIVIAMNFSIVSPGKVAFSVKRYNSPKEAFQALVPEEAVQIERNLGYVAVDAYNGVYVAVTSNEEVLLAQMRAKGEKYFCVGVFSLIPAEEIAAVLSDEDRIASYYYKDSGGALGTLSFGLQTAEVRDGEGNYKEFYRVGDLDTVYFVWQMSAEGS